MANWIAYDGGKTIGGVGSENGVILEDEEYDAGARITLERGAEVAPFAITCGGYGLFLHTRFLSTEDETRSEYAEMKVELARMVDLSASDGVSDGAMMEAAGRFVERFPT
jgi:hypothetical protein